MGARHDLRDLIAADAPTGWDIHSYPAVLKPFKPPAKRVSIVIEQRELAAGTTSPDAVNGIPIGVALTVWVVVDGSLGEDPEDTEDRLEEATEQLIRIFEKLPDHVWDGTATRNQYDTQKPAYDFTIRAAGALTIEE